MLEALWSVEFGSNQGILGAGVAVFETGRVLGGDSAFMYVGSYEVDRGTVTSNIRVSKYNNLSGMQSVFGPLNEFNLKLTGQANPKLMALSGHVVENPELKITINAVRREELP